jgi:hypothetical protein
MLWSLGELKAVILICNISDVPHLSASDELEDPSFMKVAESRAWVV